MALLIETGQGRARPAAGDQNVRQTRIRVGRRLHLLVVISGAFALHVLLFLLFGLLGQIQMLPPEWVVSAMFPGWELFWSHGIHSDSLFLGFALGALVNMLAYAVLIQLSLWVIGALSRRPSERGGA